VRYIAKKLAALVATLLIISILAFLAFQIIPGDPTTKLLGTEATPEKTAALRAELGLDESIPARYWHWLSGFVTGDLGRSYSYSLSVGELLSGKVAITATLSLMAFLLVVVLSVPLGILLARYEGGIVDKVMNILNQILMSIPPFFIGIIFTSVFGLALRWFIPGDFVPFSEDPGRYFAYLFFPALAIALPKAAMTVKLLRSSILSEMGQDYVRTAYSRGNSRWTVLCRHVLRNAILPVVTFLAVTIPDIVAGSVIVEQVFAVPGLGRLLLTSVANRDFPVVQTIVVMIALLVVVVNFLADVAYQRIDPRIRLH
jgi:peptide/nickel transport system permease protein